MPPHAFDPDLQPELFRGVLTRRVFAFLIDLVVLSVPVILGYIFIAVFGVITLGLGWMLFWLAWPATIVWAIVYYGASIGGPHSATMGMRVMDLERAHLVRRARLFRARRLPCRAVLGLGLVPDAAWCCWSACSTAAAGCCTISSWEPWSSTVPFARRPCLGKRPEPTERAANLLTVITSERDAELVLPG